MIKNLKGIVIDAGHGGTDSGAVGNGIIEKDLTLKIATYIANRLKELGLPVTLTRTDDTTLDPKARVNKILSAYGNDPNVLVISNHINAGGGDGAEVIYALRNDDKLAKKILEEIGATGQNVRKVYQRRLPSNPSKDYYFIHRDTGKTEPVIVEYGFLDSKGDDINQLKNNYEIYAEAVVKAIANYLNVPYTKEEQNEDYYIVKKKDTLYSIALNNNTTVTKLKELNNLVNNDLEIGQKLILPGSKITETNDYYIVKNGDTLYSIALASNTSVDELKKLNNLDNNLINIGQKILLPNNEKNYTVKPGDTLYSIASKNDLTVDELKKLNNLTTDFLNVGQTLKIDKPKNALTYMVQKGDTLYSIAKKFNTTITELKKINNLDNNLLSLNQTLIISKD